LSLVCANCHRMIHQSRPWLTVEDLAALVNASRS
jgi:5-methylcytosine-specific restriction protein A